MTKKLLIAGVASLTVFLLIPFLCVAFAGMAGMSICLILFFVVDPLVCVGIGILAGTDIRRLWWMPILSALAMPLCFCLCVLEWIPELFIYSVFYWLLSLAAMGITALIGRRSKPQ